MIKRTVDKRKINLKIPFEAFLMVLVSVTTGFEIVIFVSFANVVTILFNNVELVIAPLKFDSKFSVELLEIVKYTEKSNNFLSSSLLSLESTKTTSPSSVYKDVFKPKLKYFKTRFPKICFCCFVREEDAEKESLKVFDIF